MNVFDNQKIVVYGTGILASAWIRNNKHHEIVGVLDQTRIAGYFCDINIIDFRDIKSIDVDMIIIAATRKYIREIYFRIVNTCLANNIAIYDTEGVNLISRYGMEFQWKEIGKVSNVNENELRKLILEHDIVSFDLFDTLITRTVLEPKDIFDVVEKNVNSKYGLNITNFAQLHISADYEMNIAKYDELYDLIQKISNLDDNTIKKLKDEEIECEKNHIIRRDKMIEIMNWAKDNNKKVIITSDMYLPRSVIEDILVSLEISRYDELYISCECNANKSSGLYEFVKQNIGDQSCIHIGDNRKTDYECAVNAGLDAYLISSPYHMFLLSSINSVLQCVESLDERSFIGEYVALKFNDPFLFNCKTNILRVTTLYEVVRYYLAPIIIAYLQYTFKIVKKGKYDVVFLCSRDEKIVYNIINNGLWNDEDVDKSIFTYLLCSRRIMWRGSITSDNVFRKFIDFYKKELHLGETCKKLFADWVNVDWNKSDDDIETELWNNKEVIYQKSLEYRERYLSYLNDKCTDNILLCDLNSHGTIQNALIRVLKKNLDGAYMHLFGTDRKEKSGMFSMFSNTDLLNEYNTLLEAVFTDVEPTVWDIDCNGEFVYANEYRNDENIEFVGKIHSDIEKVMDEMKGKEKSDFSVEFSAKMLSMISNVLFENEADVINRVITKDELSSNCSFVIN